MADAFQYHPLADGEIRIMTILPSDTIPELQIELRHAKLSTIEGEYETLSYTWGDTKQLHAITCQTRKLYIGASLHAALEALRYNDKPRFIWADAICINQADHQERTRQVSLMTQIFRLSKCTIAYLGEEVDESSLALRFLEACWSNVMSLFAAFINWENGCSTSYENELLFHRIAQNWHPKDLVDQTPEDRARDGNSHVLNGLIEGLGETDERLFAGFNKRTALRAMAKLLARPWFRRAWIVQEFVISRNVILLCGTKPYPHAVYGLNTTLGMAFSKRQIQWGLYALQEELQYVASGAHQIERLLRLRTRGQDNTDQESLVQLLRQFRMTQSTRAEDKIYAFSGIAKAGVSVVPDYTLSTATIYTRTMRAMVEKDENLERLLCEACISDSTLPGLPTWVPDWNTVPQRMNFSELVCGSGESWIPDWNTPADMTAAVRKLLNPKLRRNASSSFTAGYGVGKRQYLFLDDNTLVVESRRAMEITIVRPNNCDRIPSCPNLSRAISILAWQYLYRAPRAPDATYSPTGQRIGAVFASIITADQYIPPQDPYAPRSGLYMMQRGLNWLEGWEISVAIELPHAAASSSQHSYFESNAIKLLRRISLEQDEAIQTIARAIAGRAFAMMEGMYAGLVPETARSGDEVHIINSMPVPVVLRKIAGKPGHYTLIGDCYIHGLMHGEFMEGKDHATCWAKSTIH